jgi:hypothetical protein
LLSKPVGRCGGFALGEINTSMKMELSEKVDSDGFKKEAMKIVYYETENGNIVF